MHNDPGAQPDAPESSPEQATTKRAWTAPAVTELPRLTELTLQSITGDGDTGGGGSTVF